MGNNPILDQLRATQENAFKYQQSAFENMKRIGQERTAMNAELERSWARVQDAKARMNSAYEAQQQQWENYKYHKARLSTQIDAAKSRADSCFQSMQRAFQRASDAYQYGDKASAPIYSAEGKAYQSDLSSYNAEVKRLVAETKSITPPSSNFSYYKDEYTRAKSSHESLQSRYQDIKRRHEAAKAEFERAQADQLRAAENFKAALNKHKAEKAKREESDRELMDRANIPFYYRDNCVIQRKPDGTVNFYFGGIGGDKREAGYSHAHVAMDAFGRVFYNRPEFEKHGAHNYTIFVKRVEEQKRRGDSDDGVYRGYRVGRDGLARTDYFFSGMKGNTPDDGHGHIVFDENGNFRHARDAFDPSVPGAKRKAVIFDDGKPY